ncbi:AraC family transcriptional regulator [Enterococcus hirae]|nr:AraC family transcriptional regulator [Enterococcus hirae]
MTISTYFPFRKTEQIQLYHTTSYLYGYFCFKSDQDEISHLLAYSSQSHFIQVFKKVAGCTPKEYKSIHYAHSLV